MTNEPDIAAILSDVRRRIATAKLIEMEAQALRLGDLVGHRLLDLGRAVDVLYDAALANGLVALHGDQLVQEIISNSLQEVAA